MMAGTQGLVMHGVESRGIANYERINLQATAPVNSANYLLGVGMAVGNAIYPQKDLLFWPGNAELITGDWLVVYTGSGQHRVEVNQQSPSNRIFTLYWGRPQTIFHLPSAVALFMEIGGYSTSTTATMPIPQIHMPQAVPVAAIGGVPGR